ncbi:MAG TPA: MgtC/SapB family protein [Syntrophomonadaceae bacterium]|jgi:putative Mg2+ transporter-C (MgtC) family protein|nr:MgtC/SapB family protein [Syntrophomonadaceae bacterium]HOQ09843.1 MgtC/SapB family protein [Syntrophomonadaceae bacterium]HPU48863.1 MgtC/SapB family protein [Syntrophomonadaceae bacterium]
MIDFVVRVLVAGVVGLIIGLFTTNARRARMFGLVTAAAALITITSTEFYKEVAGPWFSDPGRLSAQIVSALGFIGTGLIWISSDKRVRGLSVSASLWLSAIVGMLIGAGLKHMSTVAVLVVLLIYWSTETIIKWKKVDKGG